MVRLQLSNPYEARHTFQRILLYVALGMESTMAAAMLLLILGIIPDGAGTRRGAEPDPLGQRTSPAEGRVHAHARGLVTKKALINEDFVTFLDESLVPVELIELPAGYA